LFTAPQDSRRRPIRHRQFATVVAVYDSAAEPARDRHCTLSYLQDESACSPACIGIIGTITKAATGPGLHNPRAV
jgi:hypothetical protein